MNLGTYRKLVACVVGLAVLFLKDHAGIDLSGQQDVITTLALDGATAVSVWYFANDRG